MATSSRAAPTTPDLDELRRRTNSARLRLGLMVGDAIAIMTGLVLAFAIQQAVGPAPLPTDHATIVLAALTGPAWLAAMAVHKLYVTRTIERPCDEFRRLLLAGATAIATVLVAAMLVGNEVFSRFWVVTLFAFVTIALAIERRIARWIFARMRRSGRLRRRVAIVGVDEHALGLAETVHDRPELGYEVIGFVGDAQPSRPTCAPLIGTVDGSADALRRHHCSGALISLASIDAHRVNQLTRSLTDDGFHVALSTSLRDIDVTRMRPQSLDGESLIYVEPTLRNGWRARAKRAFDITTSVIGIGMTSPVMVLAAIAIRLESRGPILFRQQRVGRDGRPFEMIKFRTMYADAEERKAELMALNEADGPLFKISHDPRITRVGRVLRKLSIDELPQFWNVIRGEMSVVGPRPALPDEVEQWDEELHERLRVQPGITGMWQVSGRSDSSFDAYKRLDLYYVDNWSLAHDLRIVGKTFGAVASGRGAS